MLWDVKFPFAFFSTLMCHHRRTLLLNLSIIPVLCVHGSIFPFAAHAQSEVQSSNPRYMGVASCASSNCHGSATPRVATNVRQNEYISWYKHEAHSQAWNTLQKNDSKIIAKHLGLQAPEKEPLCLNCHATYVPDGSLHGPKYRLADGVGCESCHGPAENYLQPHTQHSNSHLENVKLGMTDLVSLSVRAQGCMKCHFGTDDQTVNHRLIGAGHPRLTYELDTYGVLQPNHWEIDDDYVQRKAAYNPARAWFAGQVARARAIIEALKSEKRSKSGAWPELSLFTCYQCHHSLQEEQWKNRSYGGHPGELRLNLSSLKMIEEGLRVLNPSLSNQFKEKVAALNSSYSQGSASSVVSELTSLLDRPIRSLVETQSYTPAIAKTLLNHIAKFGATASFLPYETAEQCAMALSALSLTVDPSGRTYQKKINAVYETLKNEKTFQPELFGKAMEKLE